MPRFFVDLPLATGTELALPPGPARHVQVRRLQPGDALTLFNGRGGQWAAVITHMGRSQVHVAVGAHTAIEREAARPVHLACGLMAAERMDWLVEKATELGAASVQPLLAERSSLRPSGERASKKCAHWQAVAAAACEQSGRNRLPAVHAVQPLAGWLAAAHPTPGVRLLLSLDAGAVPLGQAMQALPAGAPVTVVSGPEGGFSPAEEAAALAAGCQPVGLGARVLRAETAPLAALAALLVAG